MRGIRAREERDSHLGGLERSNERRRHARDEGTGCHVSAHDRVCADHRPSADRTAADDRSLGSDPRARADRDISDLDLSLSRRAADSVVVIADGDELGEERARTNLDRAPGSDRTVMAREGILCEAHDPASVRRDRRSVVDAGTLFENDSRAGLNDQSTPPADANASPDRYTTSKPNDSPAQPLLEPTQLHVLLAATKAG
jgi:hypothetical protein